MDLRFFSGETNKNKWIQKKMKIVVFFASRNSKKSQQLFILKALKTYVELPGTTMTLEVKERVLKRASERDDEWGKNVERWLLSSNDLVAEEAMYHKACMGKFCLSKPSV